MKPFITILIVLFCCTVSDAQHKTTDSILRLFNSSPIGLVDAYNSLSRFYRVVNRDSALSYATRAEALAKKSNYPAGEAIAILNKGYVYYNQSQYELCIDYSLKALSIAQRFEIDTLIANAKVSIGLSNFSKSNYSEAIRYYTEALKLYEKTNTFYGAIKARGNMALVYQMQGKLPLAESILLENLEQINKHPDTYIKLELLHTLANVYGMQGKYKEALAIDAEGMQISNQINRELSKSQFFDNIANCYMYMGKYELAFQNFMQCLRLDSSLGNQKQMSDTYLNLGLLLQMQKKYPEAIGYLSRSVSLSTSIEYKDAKYQALKLMSDIYKEKGEKDKALDFLQRAYMVKDSIINTNTENKIAELETVYQTEKKENQLILQQNELTKKNYFLWGLISLIALIGLLSSTFYRKQQIKNKMRLQTERMMHQDLATKAILTAEENERKRIAAELHDGVGQMMSAAKMNLSAFENDIQFKNDEHKKRYAKVIGLVDDSCKEVRSISHQMMPGALLNKGLAAAVKEFIDKIDSQVLKIKLHTEGLTVPLDNNIEAVLFRVIQECLNNVIKHAKATTLDISLINDADGISATIEDNGIGFDATNQQLFEGIGLKNITSRIEFLNGTVDFDTFPGKGTLIAIHIPKG